METNITQIVFEYEDNGNLTEIALGGEIEEEHKRLLEQMTWGGFYRNHTIFINKFLRPDLSINLEKLELAVTLAIKHLESVTEYHNPILLFIGGIEEYYELRGIQDKPLNKKEEYYFVRGFMQAVADNESYKKVTVNYL